MQRTVTTICTQQLLNTRNHTLTPFLPLSFGQFIGHTRRVFFFPMQTHCAKRLNTLNKSIQYFYRIFFNPTHNK